MEPAGFAILASLANKYILDVRQHINKEIISSVPTINTLFNQGFTIYKQKLMRNIKLFSMVEFFFKLRNNSTLALHLGAVEL